MTRVDPNRLYFKCRVVLEECFGSAGGVNVVDIFKYVCNESTALTIGSIRTDEGEAWYVGSLVVCNKFCFLY